MKTPKIKRLRYLLTEAEKVMTDSLDRDELSDEDGSLLADIRRELRIEKIQGES